MSFQIQLGDLTIDGTNRWEENNPSRVPVETFPRRQGGIVPTVPLKGPKRGRFDFSVYADSEIELTIYLENLKAELEKGQGKLFLRNDSRYLKAVKTNFAIVHTASNAPALNASGYIEFVIGDPYWYSDLGEQSNTQANIATSPTTYRVVNSGGAATPPRIEITALSTDKTGHFEFTNDTSGIYVHFFGTISATKKLIINCAGDPFSVTNDGVNALGGFSGSKGFLLLPGSNALRYDGVTGIDLKVAWVERWD